LILQVEWSGVEMLLLGGGGCRGCGGATLLARSYSDDGDADVRQRADVLALSEYNGV
jgi:hypothetical protein